MALSGELVFKLGDTGTELNTDAVPPFVDVTRVYGLDSSPIRETERDHEGVDGGFLDAEFEKGRPLMIDGTVYATAQTLEAYLDKLKEEWAPSPTPVPFYFRPPGQTDRVLFVKPRGLRYDWASDRRVGTQRCQFVFYAEDPRIYDAILSSVVIPFGGPAGIGFQFAGLFDTYTRNVSNGFGTSDSGHTYTLTGTAADFSCDGIFARIALNGAVGTNYFAKPNLTNTLDHYVSVFALDWSGSVPAGGNISTRIDMRVIDDSNFYRCVVVRTTSNTLTAAIQRFVGGVGTTLTSFVAVAGATASSSVSVRAEVVQNLGSSVSTIRVKVWQGAEPDAWTVEATDGSLTTAGGVRIGAVRDTGNTDVGAVVSWGTAEVWQGFGFNLNFGGGQNPAGGVVNNNGNRPTPAVLTIAGPIDKPLIVNDTLSAALSFDINLGASDTLTIDLANKTVLLNGNINRRAILIAPNWFLLAKGSNFIRFGGSSGGAPTLTIQYRHAWR